MGRIKSKRRLNDRQARFVREYLVDFNATQAAIRAGYEPNGAGQSAFKLLKNNQVKAALAEFTKRETNKSQLRIARVLDECRAVAFASVDQIFDFSGEQVKMRPANQIPDDAKRAIQSIKVKRVVEGTGDDAKIVEVTEFKLWPKFEGIDRLIRYLEFMPKETQKHELTGANGAPLSPLIQVIEIPVQINHNGQHGTQDGINMLPAADAYSVELPSQNGVHHADNGEAGEPDEGTDSV